MAKIKFRRDTAAAWTSVNPILAQGEPGFEYDTGKFKIGDGTTAWTSLSYSSGGAGTSLTDSGAVSITAGSTAYWVAGQRRESKSIYGRGVRHDSLGNVLTLTQTEDDADTVSVITKYSPTGTLLWQHTIDQATPTALAVDSSDNAYVALEGNNNLANLIKFDADGDISWKQTYNAGQWQGEAFIEERTSTRLAMTLNRQDGGANQVLVLNIDTATGDVVTQKILSNTQDNMYAAGIDTDSDGNVFVTGRYYDSNVSKDKMFVEKLDGSLDRVWSKSLETANNYNMEAGDCASDAQGNVYAVGFYDVDTTNPDGTGSETAGVLVKLNSSGVVQWTRRLGPGPCGQSVVGLTATDVGDLYLVTSTIEFKRDNKQLNDFEQLAESTARMLVAKYDTAGAVLWQRYVDAEHVWEQNDNFRGQTISVFDDKFAVDFYGWSSNTIPWNFSGTDDNESDYFLVQLPADGTELTIGDVEFKESRIPGRFITHETTASPTANEVFEGTVTVTTSTLALDPASRVANALVKSETYDYVFGPDGTLTIPNDGDIRLTQTQTGFFSVIGDTVNYNYDTHGRAVTADADGNTYVVGEDNDTGKPIVVKISPEGYRLWTVAIYDNNNSGTNGRANAVALHPTTGNVVVACEYYGNYYYGAVITLDQDTGRVLDNTTYTDNSNDIYLNDIVFQSNGNRVVGGSKNGNFADQGPFTAEAGSAAQKLVLLRSNVTGTPTTNWQIGGDGFGQFENIAAIEQYSNLTGTVREGSGAVFDLTIAAETSLLTLSASDLQTNTGGDATIGADYITTTGYNYVNFSNSGWNTILQSAGTAIGPYRQVPVTWGAGSTRSTGFVLVQFYGGDAFGFTPALEGGGAADPGTWYFPMSFVTPAGITVTVTSAGINYQIGHKIKVPYTSVGGSTTDSDVILTVTNVDGGNIVTASGTQTTLVPGTYTGVSGTNYNVGSGFTLSTFNGPTATSNYNDHNGWNANNYGTNYVNGDVIIISGDQLGGTTPANDMIGTVYSAGGGGEAYGVNWSGTAQTTTWSFITYTNVDFSQPGSWTFSIPLSRENILFGNGWWRTYGTNTGDNTDRTYAIAVDSSDNIIAATQGYGQVSLGNNYDLAVVYKFNSSGLLQWAKQLNERNDSYCEAKGVTTIGTDIYATHYSGYDGDTIISKLDATGTVKWQRRVDTSSDSSISADTYGDLVVVAEAYNNAIGDDAIKLFKLTANGETVYKRWLHATTENDTRFKNGRCLAVQGDSIHITSYYYANDYDSWFVARLPLDGSGTGEYSQFRYMDVNPMTSSWSYPGLSSDINYEIGELGSTYAGALNVEPYVTATDPNISGEGDFYVDTYYPSYFYEQIHDTDGGRIVFADGTTQNTSATDIPQRLYTGAKYTLGMRDRGHHILCQNENSDIIIPYDARVPFPIGTTITLVNDSGNTVYIYTEGGGTQVMLPGDGFYSGFGLDNYGVATLLKIGTERWVITGNVSPD